MNTPRWHAALAYALIGQELDLGHQAVPDLEDLVAELSAAGFSPDRVRSLAAHRHAVPEELMTGISYAQFAAVLPELRAKVGAGSKVVPPSTRRALDADERRLMADRPPHWG